MNKKEVIDLLNEYGDSETYIKNIKVEIEALKEEIKSLRDLTAITYSDMPKGGGTGDPTQKAAAYIVDVYSKRICELGDKIDGIMERKRLAEELVDRLTPNERKVIEARYIKGIRWDFIPGTVFMSRSVCFYHKKKAFEKMCK